jgi:hypothetical protein
MEPTCTAVPTAEHTFAICAMRGNIAPLTKTEMCYRTTTGEVGIVGDMVELDGSDSQATADYRPCQRRRLALGSV